MTLPYPNSPTGDENERDTPARLLANLEHLETLLENEVSFPLRLSNTITAAPVVLWSPGREIVLHEAFLNVYSSTGISKSISMSLQLFSDQSMCTAIGSIAFGTAETNGALGMARNSASITSIALTSTDIVAVGYITGASNTQASSPQQLMLRYREK